MTWLKSIFGLMNEKVVYRAGSQFNPILEVIEKEGHLQLDTPHVNYSFGELHSSFQQLFRKMDIRGVDPESVLILGFGAGSVASILRYEYKLNCRITGVEIDPEVMAIGRRFFGTDALTGLTIREEDAFLYMEKNRDKFDLVVVDLYQDLEVPLQAETQEFAVQMKDALNTDGRVIFNKFVYNDSSRQGAEQLGKLLAETFGNVKRYKTGHSRMNRMFVCRNTS